MINQRATLTKWDIYKKATAHLLIFGGIVGMLLIPVLAHLFAITAQHLSDVLMLSMALAVVSIASCVSVVAIFVSIAPLKSLSLLKKQESHLAFDFNEEMQQYGIGIIPSITPKWFIFSGETGVLVLRRDYVAKIENIKLHRTSTGRITGKATIVTADRKIVTLKHTKETILKFEQWVKYRLENHDI